jgi:hypothetical protein
MLSRVDFSAHRDAGGSVSVAESSIVVLLEVEGFEAASTSL